MITGLDPSAERFLNALASIQSRTDRAQRRIASGLAVATPSDAPGEISSILQLHAEMARSSQIQSNLKRVQTETGGAEQALQTAVQLMDRATVLASEATSLNQDATTRGVLAEEVKGILEQLVSISSTAVEGRYVFSGDDDSALSYQVNLLSENGVDRLITPLVTRQIEEPAGTRFTAARTAGEIFDARNDDDTFAPNNVFAAVSALYTALETNDMDGLSSVLGSLRASGNHLNSMLSHYGTTQGRISSALESAQRAELQFKSELGDKQDADLSEAILELTQGTTQLQAALSARAKVPVNSLFDLLG